MNRIIITGASGLVATELTMMLISDGNSILYLITTSPEKLKKRYEKYPEINIFTLEEFVVFAGKSDISFNVLIHAAFARSSEGDQIVKSLEYSRKVLVCAAKINLEAYINISSQSVYGQKTPPFWKEDTILAPNYLYAQGKYVTELLTDVMLNETKINYTSVRLSSVCENARFLNIFVQNAINKKPIKILGGSQTCSFIDVRDVAKAIVTMIVKQKIVKFERQYNLGVSENYTIEELAFMVKEIAKKDYGRDVEIVREDANIKQDVGMDSSLFMHSFGWEPEKSIEEMIRSLFEFILNGGGYPISFKIVYNSE